MEKYEKYKEHYKKPSESLEMYEAIGSHFIKCPSVEHVEFIKLIDKIFSTPPDVYHPYVFVCRSSGTGKSQLPFSLDIPLMYFLPSENARGQHIYQNFSKESSQLAWDVRKDMRSFEENFKELYPDSECCFNMKDINDVGMKDHRFMTLGFLVEFMAEMIKLREQKQMSWTRAENSVEKFYYSSLTIAEAKERLSVMFSGTRKPTIFFDEIYPLSEKHDKFKFRMLRSLVRSVRLAWVEMTTNAPGSELFMAKDSCEKTIGVNDDICYLVYKLPPMCHSYLETERARVIEVMQKDSIGQKLGFDFIDFLFHQVLSSDRPWFVLTICEKLEELFTPEKREVERSYSNSFYPLGDVYLKLQEILSSGEDETLDESKQKIKKAEIYLFEALLNIMFECYLWCKGVAWNQTFFRGQFEFLDPKPSNQGSVHFINKHTAYFEMPDTLQDGIYVQARVSQSDTSCLEIVSQDGSSVQVPIKTVMPKFDEELLTGLCFIGSVDTQKRFFRYTRGNTLGIRVTCLEQYFNCFQPTLLLHQREKTTDRCLEQSVTTALIVASHAQSLGCALDFKTFLESFLRDLQDIYEDKPVVCCDQKAMWSQLSNIRMPFCGPVSTKWNDTIYQYLTDNYGSLLGMVVEHADQDAIHAKMYSGIDESNVVLTAECRLDSKKLDKSELEAKLAELASRPNKAPINMLLVRQLTSFKSFKMSKKLCELLEKQGIWLVKVQSSKVIRDPYSFFNSYEVEERPFTLITKFKPAEFKGQVYILMDMQSIAPDLTEKLNKQKWSKQASGSSQNASYEKVTRRQEE